MIEICFAAEESRVRLEGENAYINASYISGLIPVSEKAYIATQGPLANTIEDFWAMVWQTNACVVVMLTRQIENQRVRHLISFWCFQFRTQTQVKCEKYWPGSLNEPIDAGNYTVSVEKPAVETTSLLTRYLVLKNNTVGRRICGRIS